MQAAEGTPGALDHDAEQSERNAAQLAGGGGRRRGAILVLCAEWRGAQRGRNRCRRRCMHRHLFSHYVSLT